MRTALLCCLLALTMPLRSHAQGWRTALLVGAEASLWIDYSQIHYGLAHHSPTWVLSQRLTPTSLALVNGAEVLANAFAPRRLRPWLNAVTLGFHAVSIYQTAHRPIAVRHLPTGREVLRIGVRFWP
jgi:hypothetical protein